MAVKSRRGLQDAGPGFFCKRQECPRKAASLV